MVVCALDSKINMRAISGVVALVNGPADSTSGRIVVALYGYVAAAALGYAVSFRPIYFDSCLPQENYSWILH